MLPATPAPVLLSLMDELDRLAGEMRARQAEYETELRELAKDGGRKLAALVPCGGARAEPLGGEIPHHVPHDALLFG